MHRNVGLLILSLVAAAQVRAASCESLSSLKLEQTTITVASSIAAGAFDPGTTPVPAGRGASRAAIFGAVPAFCRVAATLTPTSDSEIKIEVWLPAPTDWNGKFLATGNGGWSGAIGLAQLGGGVTRHYATASTDTGHSGGTAEFAFNHPEKLIDFGYRAVHLMTVRAKEIVAAYYGNGPKYSYWNGCSSGGKQGLKEAQRYPEDFNGIIAGAPAHNWTRQMTGELWIGHATLKNPASTIPATKFPMIKEAALAACDSNDGVRDGLIENPAACRFDPKVLTCRGADGPSCLTAPQAEAAAKIYAPAMNPRTKKAIYPGLAPGSEMGWGALAGGPKPFQIAEGHFKYIVLKNPAWDWLTLDFDKDATLADKLDKDTINAVDPNLKPFFARGGKLIMFHGWNDQLIAPMASIDYYNSVAAKLGGAKKIDGSYRLFMEPGVGHCGGSDGPSYADWITSIEQWVENGKAPEALIARTAPAAGGAAPTVPRTRPLCAYPQVAKYKGSGSIDDAANFACVAPSK